MSTLTKKLNLKKAAAKTDVEVSQPDNIYPDLQAFFETDVALQSVTDVPVNSVNVCGARRRSQGLRKLIVFLSILLLCKYKLLPKLYVLKI